MLGDNTGKHFSLSRPARKLLPAVGGISKKLHAHLSAGVHYLCLLLPAQLIAAPQQQERREKDDGRQRTSADYYSGYYSVPPLVVAAVCRGCSTD